MKTDNDIKPYRVFAYGYWCIVIFMGGGMILPLIIMETILDHFNIVLFITIFGITITTAYYAAKSYGLRPIQIQFDNEKITFNFLTRDLKDVKKTKTFLLKYINGFSDFNFGGDLTFKLKFNNKSEFTIYKSRMWNRKDDFEILIHDFKEFIDKYKSPGELTTDRTTVTETRTKIEYKDFFHTQIATILFFVAIGLGVIMIFMATKGQSKSLSGTLIVIGGVLGYIGTYIVKRLNKKE